MPDLSGLPALDVVIGMAFVFFVFSLIASGVNESVASLFKLRARFLEKGLRNMLAHPAETKEKGEALLKSISEHPLVRGTVHPPRSSKVKPRKLAPWRRSWPSYLPSRTFALALLDTIAPPDFPKQPRTKRKDKVEGAEAKAGHDDRLGEESHDVLTRLREDVTGWQPPEGAEHAFGDLPKKTQQALTALIDDARGDVNRFRENVETWFDDSMDRVSGWYKRRVQIILLIISIAVVGLFNVDSFTIANSLLNNETLRTVVAAQAQKATDAGGKPSGAKAVETLQSAKLPIGWAKRPAKLNPAKPADPRWMPRSTRAWVGKVFGLIVSALALTLGAPFWFDLLSRFARLRGTGVPEGGPKERRPRSDPAPAKT